MRNQSGISLIEMLVVIAIFAFVGTIVTRAIVLTLQGTQKSTSIVSARENLDYAMGIIERQIRNANSITSDCFGNPSTEIDYVDQDGSPGSFSCQGTGSIGSYIASGSATPANSLTNSSVEITGCSFTCSATGTTPPVVSISLTVQNAATSGIGGGDVSSSTQIDLRNY
jgi:prepilin-type N-terminal cleavage/methylation domain-containing protein